MAALTGAKLAAINDLRQADTISTMPYMPAVAPEMWLAMTHVVGHGVAITHSTSTLGNLADTDVETSVAELDQYTDKAPGNPTNVDITASVKAISIPVSMESEYFPTQVGLSARDNAMMQMASAFKQYHDEAALDLIASFSNSTTLGVTLGREEFITIKIALMAQNPQGQVYNALMHTSDFGNFIKDVGALGSPLASLSVELLRMKPQGFQGNWEGVDVYTNSRIDEHDGDEWQGAIVCGEQMNPVIATMEQYNAPGFVGTGLIMGPAKLTLKEFFGVMEAPLTSDIRLGSRLIGYHYGGLATVNHNQAHRWRSNKT